jgi:hypothetical protein
MGVRLVVHNFEVDEMDYTGTHNHDDLLHRDWVDQHPIYAITGLQEVLNTIEINLINITNLINENDIAVRNDFKQYTDTKVTTLSDTVNARIDDLNVVDKIIDTDSIDLTYNETTNSLKADVIIHDDPEGTNSLVCTPDGLYVPKMVTQDTATITWDSVSQGESLIELFANGIRFSHNGTNNNMYNAAEANAWYWDNSLQSFVQPQNAVTYNGFVTQNLYDNYKHTVRLYSSDSDDDINGVVIGFVFDDNGYPHTLSAVIQRGNDFGSFKFALYYNFYLPNQTLIANYALTNSNSGWSGKNITLYITKEKNIVSASVTPWDYDNTIASIGEAALLPFEHTLSIDLNNYSWGHLFASKVHYGYSNISQPQSSFGKVFFYSKSQHTAQNMFASVKIQDEPNNAIQVNEKGLFVQEFLISPDENNALTQHENGYFAKATAMNIADKRLNGLEQPATGEYYVHKSHSFIDVTQANHEFIIGDFIYYDNRTNLYQKAIAKDDFDINIVGMVSYIYDANKFEYVCSGLVETDLFTEDNGYVQGMPLYISDLHAGKVTQEQPNISKAVGYPIANIGLIISIERGIQYSQEAQIGDFKYSANDYNIRSDGYIKVAENIDFKMSTVHKLLDHVDQEFKDQYIIIDTINNILKFQNVDSLYDAQKVPVGLNLFVKAF